ncbi:hypothetical protein GLYMA_07G148966v4 [Glycine max]|nr:hypothetical protein GLYMA_07G148966v4 [Glycine max]KAH1086941.1 hypothetical protein GYH30_018451 [Glycine max]
MINLHKILFRMLSLHIIIPKTAVVHSSSTQIFFQKEVLKINQSTCKLAGSCHLTSSSTVV